MNLAKQTIIDFKRISPKDGDLFGGKDPVATVKELEKKGVLGISVVTEQDNFGGSIDLLRQIRAATRLPLLRKDFITSVDEILITKECKADAVLLILSTINDFNLAGVLFEKALELKLHPLVEVHTAEEMKQAIKLKAKIIGINNRDIANLELDDGTVNTTKELIKQAPKDAFIISESGIRNNADAVCAINYGANAVLVGTAFWKGKFVI